MAACAAATSTPSPDSAAAGCVSPLPTALTVTPCSSGASAARTDSARALRKVEVVLRDAHRVGVPGHLQRGHTGRRHLLGHRRQVGRRARLEVGGVEGQVHVRSEDERAALPDVLQGAVQAGDGADDVEHGAVDVLHRALPLAVRTDRYAEPGQLVRRRRRRLGGGAVGTCGSCRRQEDGEHGQDDALRDHRVTGTSANSPTRGMTTETVDTSSGTAAKTAVKVTCCSGEMP